MSAFEKGDWYSPVPLWKNGPAPGSIYNFPGPAEVPTSCVPGGIQRTQTPMATSTSVIGVHFKDGVVLAADVLASYGSLARYRNCERIIKVNDNVILGAGGDYADYQYLKSMIEQKILEENCLNDGFKMKPQSLHCWLTRVMYYRRSKYDPLWNNLLIAGIDDGKPFLGTVDKLGTAYVDPVIATGYGAYIATPLLRAAYDKNNNMSEQEATELIYKCMQVLFYRDARSFPKYHLGIITKDKGVEIKGPITLEHHWEVAAQSH